MYIKRVTGEHNTTATVRRTGCNIRVSPRCSRNILEHEIYILHRVCIFQLYTCPERILFDRSNWNYHTRIMCTSRTYIMYRIWLQYGHTWLVRTTGVKMKKKKKKQQPPANRKVFAVLYHVHGNNTSRSRWSYSLVRLIVFSRYTPYTTICTAFRVNCDIFRNTFRYFIRAALLDRATVLLCSRRRSRWRTRNHGINRNDRAIS